MELRMESGDKDEMLTEESGDSIQKRIIIRKRIKDAHDFMNDAEMRHFHGMPPMPPMPPMNRLKDQHSSRIIDLNDPNIISYHKKSLKGGREKIEIIRNKPIESNNMNFSYNFGDNLDVPESPEAPGFRHESKDNHNETKIIEKDEKVKGKEDKEIKVEVETNDQK